MLGARHLYYLKCSLLARQIWSRLVLAKINALLACSQMLAKTIRYPYLLWLVCLKGLRKGGSRVPQDPLAMPLTLQQEFPFSKIQTIYWTSMERDLPGAIIGDGDRKRAPFLVLELSPWYGTIILFLEQIAPSPTAHAPTCCEDFCGCRAGEKASEIPEIFHVFQLAHNSTRLRLLEFCLSIFVVSCSSLSEVRQCLI